MKAYKIFRRRKGVLCSALTPIDFSLYYEKGEKTVAPKPSKLFVFNAEDKASRWINNIFGRGELWGVEVDGLEHIRVVPNIAALNNLDIVIDEFWIRRDTGRASFRYQSNGLGLRVPSGTMVCDWVKPIRLIERVDE